MPYSIRPGEVLGGRYRLVDLLTENQGGWFWRAHDSVLARRVAIHVIASDDDRAPELVEAARRSAKVLDRRLLRVLDVDTRDGICYVVNEWGSGVSLDIVVNATGPLGPRRSGWLVSEVADSIARAHEKGIAHGRLTPENVLIDRSGEIRIIGFCVEAALHGLPTGRETDDVTDLAGLLYCALTARWAGASESQVPDAPTHHGRVLRPRRVRAGIPRPLDALCDRVLDPSQFHGEPMTARGLAEQLAEFVGDPTGIQQALLSGIPRLGPDEQIVLPQVPDIPARDTSDLLRRIAAPVEEPDGPDEPQDEAPDQPALDEPQEDEPDTEEPERPAGSADLPTEAGMPIFGAADEVEWFRARRTESPPPPPFEDPPERPLFAPEPEDGAPSRRSRHPHDEETSVPVPEVAEHWAWDSGTGRLARVEEEMPGRNWFRLGLALAAGVLLLLAVVVAFNLGRGKTVLGTEPDDAPSSQRSSRAPAPAEPIEGLGATDLDPQGGTEAENPEDAPLAVDGDPATAWTTVEYFDQLGPNGLKTGVGLVIDLAGTREVSSVQLELVGAPSGIELYFTGSPPDSLDELTPAVSETAETESVEVELDEPVTAGFMVVWLTALPADGDRFRGGVAEVVVRGE